MRWNGQFRLCKADKPGLCIYFGPGTVHAGAGYADVQHSSGWHHPRLLVVMNGKHKGTFVDIQARKPLPSEVQSKLAQARLPRFQGWGHDIQRFLNSGK